MVIFLRFEVREEHWRSFLGKIVIKKVSSGKSYIYLIYQKCLMYMEIYMELKLQIFQNRIGFYIGLNTLDTLYLIKKRSTREGSVTYKSFSSIFQKRKDHLTLWSN